MSSSGNNPSLNPADQGSLAGTLKFVFGKMMQDIEGMIPAKIIKYDRATNRAQVQLLIMMLTTDGSKVSRSQVASVPVLLLGGGGYMVNFPLSPGDLGWLAANDRDISLFLQTYAESPPNTNRTFEFSDGLFIPDVMRGYTIDPLDADNAVLQNLDGSIKISFGATQITIKAPLVEIDGALAATGGITVTGGGASPVTITGDVNMTGTLGVSGALNVTGNSLMTGNLHVTGTFTNP